MKKTFLEDRFKYTEQLTQRWNDHNFNVEAKTICSNTNALPRYKTQYGAEN